jgi:hypothetical protein
MTEGTHDIRTQRTVDGPATVRANAQSTKQRDRALAHRGAFDDGRLLTRPSRRHRAHKRFPDPSASPWTRAAR